MKFAKEGRAKYISHLDLMHAMQRSMARCQMPLWFTEGFSQHAYVSVALPLSTGYSGECEFLDFNITSEAGGGPGGGGGGGAGAPRTRCLKMQWKRSTTYFRKVSVRSRSIRSRTEA